MPWLRVHASVPIASGLALVVGCSSGSHDGSGASAGASPPFVDAGGFEDASDAGTVAIDGGSPAEASIPDVAAPLVDAGEDGPSDAAPTGPGPYGADGPYGSTTASLQVTAPNGTFTTIAYVPAGAGPFPVVVLSSGFFQTAAAYAPYAQRLASWGVLTLLRDDPSLGESTPNLVSDVTYTVKSWLPAQDADAGGALRGKVDLSRVGLAGHSRGGQVALLAGEALSGRIEGVFGLDPVDQSMGSDPEARTTLASIGVPVAFIGETTDSASSSCAPAADNYQVLYAAASSPAVAITAIAADHTMFELASACSFCTLCTAGTASQPDVLAMAVRYLTAFFARQLLGDATVGKAFAGAGASQDEAAGRIQLVSK
jgi:dienelactone hydrolase